MRISGQIMPPADTRAQLEASVKQLVDSGLGSVHVITAFDSLTGTELYTETLGAAAFDSYVTAISLHISQAQTAGTVTARIKADGTTVLEAVIDTASQDTAITKGGPGNFIPALSVMTLELESVGYTPQPSEARAQVHLMNDEVLPYAPFSVGSEYIKVSRLSGTQSVAALNDIWQLNNIEKSVGTSIQYDTSNYRFTLQGGTYLFVLSAEVSASSGGTAPTAKLYNVTDAAFIDGAAALCGNADTGGGTSGTMYLLLTPQSTTEYEVRTAAASANARIGNRDRMTNVTILRID